MTDILNNTANIMWDILMLGVIILGVFIVFVLIKNAGKWIKNIKNVKIGPLALETRETQEKKTMSAVGCEAEGGAEGDSGCPHRYCNDARNKTTRRIWERLDAADTVNKDIRDMLGRIEDNVQGMREDIDVNRDSLEDMRVMQLKMTFYLHSIPEPDRLKAGVQYILLGHNSQMKEDVIEFCLMHGDMYRMMVNVQPKLRVAEIDSLLESARHRRSTDLPGIEDSLEGADGH